MKPLIETNVWQVLRRFTPARIALGRAGDSLPTTALLDFGLAHAQARDAVHAPLDVAAIQQQLIAAGYDSIAVRSTVADRNEYLRRPDFGRCLDEASRAQLLAQMTSTPPQLVFVIADGLSAMAAMHHAVSLLQAVHAQLTDWTLAPIIIAEHARVALGDAIGELLNAEQVVMLIGERPGLSSPHSLGIYLTYAPHIGRIDAERNCISNVRPEGLSYAQAAHRLVYLLNGARRLGRSGIALKDDSDQVVVTKAHS